MQQRLFEAQDKLKKLEDKMEKERTVFVPFEDGRHDGHLVGSLTSAQEAQLWDDINDVRDEIQSIKERIAEDEEKRFERSRWNI
jgi:hypothetical protein